jgi:hypothetical protein
MADEYIRNPKGTKGSKYGPCEQDEEDFGQEKLIQDWIKSQGNAVEFEFQHINRKGNARNTLVKAQVRLDQQISEDGSGTFADLIAGSDGRDLYCGGDVDESQPEPHEKIHGYLSALNFNQGEITWLIKTLKLSILENKLLLEKSVIDLEW